MRSTVLDHGREYDMYKAPLGVNHDTYTNQSSVTFPASSAAYGLVRHGEWGTATIPVAEIAGPLVALQSMLDLFQFFCVDGALPASPLSTEAQQIGPTMLGLAATASGWMDAHYTVNFGDTQTVRMRRDGTSSRYAIGGLKKGDVVEARFTAWDKAHQVTVDSAAKTVFMK